MSLSPLQSRSNSSTEIQLGNTTSNAGSPSIGTSQRKKQESSARGWSWTYNNPPGPTDPRFEAFIKTLDRLTDQYVFQEEVGNSGTKHYQGWANFKKKLRFTALRSTFPKEIHWEKNRSKKHAIAYCSDPTKRSNQDHVWAKGVDLPEPLKVISRDDFYPWQSDVWDIAMAEPDDRSIYWFFEQEGNVGKSALCKKIRLELKSEYVSGKINDVKYLLGTYWQTHNRLPKIILYDIPRVNENYISWAGLESIKNGLFTVGKYESFTVIANSPTVFCFANFYPDVTKLSADRWKIFEIRDKQLFRKPVVQSTPRTFFH